MLTCQHLLPLNQIFHVILHPETCNSVATNQGLAFFSPISYTYNMVHLRLIAQNNLPAPSMSHQFCINVTFTLTVFLTPSACL